MAGAKLTFSKLKALSQASDEIAEKALSAIAFAIQEEAQNNAPRDTSALANSIYTETPKSSNRADAIAAAQQSREGARIATEVPLPAGKVKVAVAVEYGAYVELGTNRMDAQPYLTPAAEQIGREAEAIAGRVVAEEIKRIL